MKTYIAFLRAVNVGGTGRLPMQALRSMCSEIGFTGVRTYIASGNVLLCSNATSRAVQSALEHRLREYAAKSVAVFVRTATELRAILERNPFADREPQKTIVIFLDGRPPKDALAQAVGQSDEKMHLGKREIYVYCPSGIGRSRLRIPAAKNGTGRNMNTIAKMVEMVLEIHPAADKTIQPS